MLSGNVLLDIIRTEFLPHYSSDTLIHTLHKYVSQVETKSQCPCKKKNPQTVAPLRGWGDCVPC